MKLIKDLFSVLKCVFQRLKNYSQMLIYIQKRNDVKERKNRSSKYKIKKNGNMNSFFNPYKRKKIEILIT